MSASPILTNVAILLLVAALWGELKHSGRLDGPGRGLLVAAGALALTSAILLLAH